jgi:hypothetical protein
MLNLLINAVFCASVLVVINALIGSWRRYGDSWRALEAQAVAGVTMGQVRVTMRSTTVTPSATIYRPRFGDQGPSLLTPDLFAWQDGLPFAA